MATGHSLKRKLLSAFRKGGEVEHFPVLRREGLADPLPVCGGSLPDIHPYVKDRTFKYQDQFSLGEGVFLIMETAQHPPDHFVSFQ